MDVIISAATPAVWWMLAKACFVFAGLCVIGAITERLL